MRSCARLDATSYFSWLRSRDDKASQAQRLGLISLIDLTHDRLRQLEALLRKLGELAADTSTQGKVDSRDFLGRVLTLAGNAFPNDIGQLVARDGDGWPFYATDEEYQLLLSGGLARANHENTFRTSIATLPASILRLLDEVQARAEVASEKDYDKVWKRLVVEIERGEFATILTTPAESPAAEPSAPPTTTALPFVPGVFPGPNNPQLIRTSAFEGPEADVERVRAILRAIEPDSSGASAKMAPRSVIERVNPMDGAVLVQVPSGRFFLGSENLSARLRPECRDWARPAHVVMLSEYWISKYPITNSQYARFLDANSGHPKPMYWDTVEYNGLKKPVVGVTWFDAQAYCVWAGLSLPTEAQWEAAARGPEGRIYPWGNDPPTPARANFGTNFGRTTDVDLFAASKGPFGTVDQAGNVWEWCLDSWDPDAYKSRTPVQLDPFTEPSASSSRVLRGGSGVYEADYLAAAAREPFKADHNSRFIGFRAVQNVRPV